MPETRIGSPRLTEDEWVLLLDLYVRRRLSVISSEDPELVALSKLLGAAAGTPSTGRMLWRSPDGLRARLSVFRVLDPEIDTIDTKRATLASRVWAKFANDAKGLDMAAERIRKRLVSGESRNPDWTWDETVLGLATYLSIRPRYASAAAVEILKLSTLLQAVALRGGVTGASTYRNPAGVARKVNKFRAAEVGQAPRSVGGAYLEAEVWKRFSQDPKGLAKAVEAISEGLSGPSELHIGVAPSRGPRPSFGSRSFISEDGDTSVYLLQLSGNVALLYPGLDQAGLAVIKVGRSNDVDRRQKELNCGFPPDCKLAWKAIGTIMLPNADTADDVEQWLLHYLERRGLTIGGEFSRCPVSELSSLLKRAQDAQVAAAA